MSQRAVVVFLGHDLFDGHVWWARWLKNGFVHCFVLVESNGWIKIEYQYGAVKVTQLGEFADIVAHYRDQGAIVVSTMVSTDPIRSPVLVRTCVGLVKEILGVKSFSLTPWQLFNCLTRG